MGASAVMPAAPAQQTAPAASYRSASPFVVGSKSQLFIDRVLLRDVRNISFTLHPAERHPKNPLMIADRPWEGWRLELFGNVIYDEDERLFKMWYVPEPVGWFGPAPNGASGDNPTCYATSRDGIHWEKPLVGSLKSPDGTKTNALLFATHLPSVFKDKSEPDPRKRYKMTCYINQPRDIRGYRTMVSPDGLRWTLHSKTPICRSADVITSYYDTDRRMFVAMAKIGTRIRGHNRRIFYVTTSTDFDNWTEAELAIYPDLEDDAGSLGRIEEARSILDVADSPEQMRTEFYGVGFHQAESCTLGFPWVFTINNEARYGNQEGPFEIQLAVSRDLKEWQRPFRIPCLPRGTDGDWECGIQQTASSTVRVGDEVWLYYCGANYTHGTPVLYRQEGTGRKTKYTSSIGLAKWKVDRFVSADAAADGGVLTTVPVLFTGDRLEVNARTRPGGSLAVELLDAARRTLSGFPKSNPIRGDNVRHLIRWPGNSSLSAHQGKPVSLRFHLRDAQLFAFAFREGGQRG